MKKKNRLILIIIILIFLIAGILFFLFSNKKENMTSELFTVEDTSALAKILITKDTLQVRLTKNKKNGIWTVNDKYPANKKAVKRLYQALTEAKINKPVEKSALDSVLRILKNRSEKVSIFGAKNKLIKTLYISNSDKNIGGTYMLNASNNTPFIVNIPGLDNNLGYRFSTQSSYWMKRIIFSYSPREIKEISLHYPDKKEQSFKLIISDNAAQLFKTNKQNIPDINMQKTGAYLSYFMNVYFSKEAPKDKLLKQKLLQGKAFAELKVEDIHQQSKAVKLYKIPNKNTKSGYDLNNLYALINDTNLVIVKYTEFDLILKDINYFIH